MLTGRANEWNEALLRDLWGMGCRGAEIGEMADHIRRALGLQESKTVPIIPIMGYLCKAFFLPLIKVLPLRDEGFQGPHADELKEEIAARCTATLEQSRV